MLSKRKLMVKSAISSGVRVLGAMSLWMLTQAVSKRETKAKLSIINPNHTKPRWVPERHQPSRHQPSRRE